MRTTITLEEGLLSDLKHRASERGSTVSRLIEDSVRRNLYEMPERDSGHKAFKLVTYGRGGSFPELNFDKASALLEANDLDRYGRHDP